ncbi:MAG: hypothetical protein ACTTKZ_03185, partial [Bacteroides sp.]
RNHIQILVTQPTIAPIVGEFKPYTPPYNHNNHLLQIMPTVKTRWWQRYLFKILPFYLPS